MRKPSLEEMNDEVYWITSDVWVLMYVALAFLVKRDDDKMKIVMQNLFKSELDIWYPILF